MGPLLRLLPPDEVARYFRISGPLPNFPPRYNMAPTQLAPSVRFNPETNTRHLDLVRCGLIAFAKGRRCIVPMSGFHSERPSRHE